jgi:hypothetical protein
MTRKKTATPKVANIGIKMSVDLPTVEAARETILTILESSAENETKRVALQVFQNLCGIHGATISNCNIEMGR